MSDTSTKSELYKSIIKRNSHATKVMFYLTSYGFPWWVYIIPIRKFQKLGYEVVVYDFKNKILNNDDPYILPNATKDLIQDIHSKHQDYQQKGIRTFYGVGNSLGSSLIFNYSLNEKLNAMVLNSGGAIADVIFNDKNRGSWKKIAKAYKEKGYNHQELQKLWANSDAPTLGKHMQTKKVLITYSLKDGTIPLNSTEEFVKGLKSSGAKVIIQNDRLPHIPSVVYHSLKVKSINNFLNDNN